MKINNLIKSFRRFIFKTKYEKLLQVWFRYNGNKTFKLEHDLKKDSIVFDIGCHKGRFIKDIWAKFGCKIYAFEPVKEFINCIDKSILENKDVKIYNFGLGVETQKELIYLNGDGTSIYGKGQPMEVSFVNMIEFLKENKINQIDLMELNIEGGEYELLNHLIKNRWVKNIKNIQVQFHNNVLGHEEKRKNIQDKLSETHYLTYNFPFIWENWSLK